MCGSTDIELVNGVLTCRACDTKYTLERPLKGFEKAQPKKNNYNPTIECEYRIDMAKQAFDDKDFDTALRQIGLALDADDTNAEAWLLALFIIINSYRIHIYNKRSDGLIYDDDCYPNFIVSGVWPEKPRHLTYYSCPDKCPTKYYFTTIMHDITGLILEVGDNAIKYSDGKYSQSVYLAYLVFLKHQIININNRVKLTFERNQLGQEYINELMKDNFVKVPTPSQMREAWTLVDENDKKGKELLDMAFDSIRLREAVPDNFIAEHPLLLECNDEIAENWKLLPSSWHYRVNKTTLKTPKEELIADFRAKYDIIVRGTRASVEAGESVISNDGAPPKSEGCYVATAVYGSYDCPEVWTLRRFRDDILRPTTAGRAFIKLYYRVSPTLVKWVGNTRWFNALCRLPLDRLVEHLRRQGIADTPYNDL